MLTLDSIKHIVSRYFSNLPVKEVYIFGSFAKGKEHAESDVDLIINLDRSDKSKPMFSKWQDDLQELFKCKVDLLSMPETRHVGVKFEFKEFLEREKVLLYSKE